MNNLLNHPAFAGLSEKGVAEVQSKASVISFRIGQILADPSIIADRVLVILSGEARLLVRNNNQPFTLCRLKAGDTVGLASFLRASACEEASAATEMLAVSIPDETVLWLYENEETFHAWCNAVLWQSELFATIKESLKESEVDVQGLSELCAKVYGEAVICCTSEDISTFYRAESEHNYNYDFLVSSANIPGVLPGTLCVDALQPIKPNPPFPARIIKIPKGWNYKKVGRDGSGSEKAKPDFNAVGSLYNSSDYPVATSKNLGSASDSLSEVQIRRGVGVLEETEACFQMLSQAMRLPYRKDAIEKVLREAVKGEKAPTLQTCGQLAANLGLHVVGVRVPTSLADRLQTPAMICWKDSFALVIRSNASGLTLASPKDGWVTLSKSEAEELYGEAFDLLLFDRTSTTPEERFNLNWFLPSLRRYKGVLTQVLLASFVVQLFTLANPLLIQVIIDKVIAQRSLDTLEVLGIALVAVTLLEGVLSSLRTFLFTETTNRIDMRLGAEVIDHLLRLPLSYFDKRPVGDLASRVAELEKIRNFLTGQGLTTIIDAVFSIIYIAVMALYSWVLTVIALAVVPIQVILTVLGSPLFRRQLRQAAESNSLTQSHLVEVLTGIQTVKAQNVEVVSRWKWQDRYAQYITRSFERTITGTTLSQISQVLQKVSQLLVLWVGASMVLKGELTLGQLIAFRIISSYVTQPLLRLSTIWQNIQELKVSMERLADVIDTPIESNEEDQAKIPLPLVKGNVVFEGVTFSFEQSVAPTLNNISCDFPAGTFVGVVGQSGSGKSTLMKLLPRLYKPQKGRILIDGYDIDKVELYSLRRQIGIVPQDPLLFSGTISDNVALTDSQATSDEIVRAAKLADAHDFIMRLPAGYSTQIGERGASLSGGQRQRIAIARTLLSKPRLLILDEATSALDYETEKRVCDNLMSARSDSTVFFITHRLNTVKNADIILLLNNGVIEESGTHEQLMSMKGRYYALYRQQEVAQ